MTPIIPDNVYFTYQFGVNDPSYFWPLPVMTNCDGLSYQVGSSTTVFYFANQTTDATGVFSYVGGST